MTKGFHVGKKDTYLENFVQNAGELQLLGMGDGAEIMIQLIRSDSTVFIEPGDDSELMEFFYILEGEIELVDSGKHLKQGDYFYSHLLTEPIEIKTITDTKLLYFVTQPVFRHLSKTIRELMVLSDKVEEKDTYTHSHTNIVKDYAIKLGNKLGLSKEKIQNIGLAAMFHDIGKIDIPDEILKKPGKLTDEEFDLIKEHPDIGAAMLRETYYEDLADIILQHHERIDGSGYPQALKGEEILIEAQVIGMADSYHAMASDRPYRKALSTEYIIEELTELRGKLYGEKIVDAMIEIIHEEMELKDNNK